MNASFEPEIELPSKVRLSEVPPIINKLIHFMDQHEIPDFLYYLTIICMLPEKFDIVEMHKFIKGNDRVKIGLRSSRKRYGEISFERIIRLEMEKHPEEWENNSELEKENLLHFGKLIDQLEALNILW
ncbi:hypothetical protein ND861_09455 [Leptospira sp. 2 VSF19]|uniref:Uncharacterized protein n=2 Tax=Leptospira TaxID=171 RepID=A0AAW5VKT3_9LEPT|nr:MULTISPECIES: hypothetical protein [Leptospira]MCW7467633.1 hypothetical protein [Leptospira levettii]MCW7492569.1 hypothetical protein [Leptospira soteropolitanensis]MCW7500617.1 hypothetical protein [Leptospira soteropolitanensis]MCW7513313.1 hypothetical protein [Leptospira levettii]MCW7517036.1 hypothetical protein [Leptospira levettii]